MRILGIDPGLGTTGYGVIEARGFKVVEAGVIRTKANTPIQERIKKIFDEITGIIKEHKPSVLVLEKIYSHYKHPTTSILMGHARAMACLVCGKFGIKLVSYPSTRIKKVVTGNGHASKVQVQRMVQTILKLKAAPEPVDVSDALAMALCYCYLEKRSEVVGQRAKN
jgi:crossover junction endodeoxyribonuclease RuvC